MKNKNLANTKCDSLLSEAAIAKRKAFAAKYGPSASKSIAEAK